MFCVNQGYLKATHLVTGHSSPCAYPCLNQAWATADGGRGLGGLTGEIAGGRVVVERVEGGFLPLPPSPLDLFHLTPSEPLGREPWPAPDLALSGDRGAAL